jgi:hypothetical protein
MCLFQVEDMLKNFVKNLQKKIQYIKVKKEKVCWLPRASQMKKELCFWGIIGEPKIGIL